jgi:hypothetical protein
VCAVLRNVYIGLVGKLKDGSNLEEQGEDSRVILKWILKTGLIDLDLSGSCTGTSVRLL